MKLPPGHIPGAGIKQATAYGGLGEKLLKQYGWKEGQGLGVQGTGIKTAIKVLKKDDTIGVGGRQVVRENEMANWWQQSFDSALQKVNEAISEGDSSDSDADDLDLVEKRCNRDGTIASGTAAELRLERELAKDPWGRFGGRNGKLARIRAQEAALQALQGGEAKSNDLMPSRVDRPRKKQKLEASNSEIPVDAAVLSPALRTPEHSKCSSESLEGQHPQNLTISKEKSFREKRKASTKKDSVKSSKKKGGSAKQPDLAPSANIMQGRPSEVNAHKSEGPDLKLQERPASWWGASKFVTGGCLGGLHKEETSKARKSFTENTQEELYMTTHAAKSANKKGLGAGQGKAIGHEWQGKKTAFAEDENELEQPKCKLQKVESIASGQPAIPEEQSKALEHKLARKTVAKLSRQILKKEDGKQLKLSKLIRKLVKELAFLDHGDDLHNSLARQIAACPKLLLEGKTVRLTATNA